MIPVHVALVAHQNEPEYVRRSMILRVAAALQVQLTRDFTPIWGIPAVVSAFDSIYEIPPASIPLVIVPEGKLESSEHAFHITEDGQPIAFVEAREGWSLAASHELLEVVCDPYGKTKVSGRSIADTATADQLVGDSDAHPQSQGQVAYLLEICDPCQTSTYTVNGFEVSDFVTPQYYAPDYADDPRQAGRYSFTGAITEPLQLLPGGYITWYTSMPEAPIWQATRDDDVAKKLHVGPLAGPPATYTRHDVDYVHDFLGAPTPAPPVDRQATDEELAERAARRYGEALEAELDRILLSSYELTVDLSKFLVVLGRLADRAKWERYRQNPNLVLRQLKGILPELPVYIGREFPTSEQFRAVYERLTQIKQSQRVSEISNDAAITAMQGISVWSPPPPPPPPPPPNP